MYAHILEFSPTQGKPSTVNPRERIEHELLEMFGPGLAAYFPATVHDHPAIWAGEVFDVLKSAVASGAPQAISLACELIEKDPKLPFGKLVKSNLARALRKHNNKLTEPERRQVLGVTGRLLNQEYAPRELEDYCKLVKKFPQLEIADLLQTITPKNPKSERLRAYLGEAILAEPTPNARRLP